MKVYLIRHTSVNVIPGTCYGQSDVPLNASFPEEAEQTRKQLEGLVFDHVYTSPLSRAVKLATYCGYPDATRDDRLMEINFGDWEMQRFDEITDPLINEWYENYYYVRPRNGESFQDQYERVAAFLDELKAGKDNQVAIFAHGGVLLCAQLYAGIYTKEEAWDHLPPYGGIVSIEI